MNRIFSTLLMTTITIACSANATEREPTDNKGTTMPAISSMTPLFQVYDVRKSVAFYTEKLGFELDGTYEPDGHLYWASLKRDGIALMLNACWEDDKRPDEVNPARVRGHGDTELYFKVDDVDGVYEELKKRGVDVRPPSEQHGRREVVVKDPDGFHLSFFEE